MKRLLRQIGSLRLTVVVVLLIAGFSVYGTFLRMEEAMKSVYRSPLFLGLLGLFGLNLLACTVLRLRFRLLQAGFLATHLGVLVILAGAIVGTAGGEKGHVNLADGETSDVYYKRASVNPGENTAAIHGAVASVGGKIVAFDAETIAVDIPRERLRELMHSLGNRIPYEAFTSDAGTAAVRFWPGRQIVKKPLPFAIRLERFTVSYYNHGDLLLTDAQNRVIESIPVTPGETRTIDSHALSMGAFLPNFVVDTETREATTRNQAPNNPAVQVRITPPGGAQETLWIFAKHPGMEQHMRRGKDPLPFRLYFDYRERVKSYTSRITLLDKNGGEITRAVVKVNQPLTCRGFTIYQSSYDREAHRWTGLQVVSDPGLWVVYVGFALLVVGVAFIFYVKPYLRRRGRGGTPQPTQAS